jgi:2-methylcitrate dehydratase
MDAILEQFVEFSTSLTFRDLPDSIVTLARQRLFDAIGCAVGAYDSNEGKIARALAGPPAAGAQAGRIVGTRGRYAADAAAFANTSMIRTRDFNDTYLPGGHPSDTSGALFAIAPEIGAAGTNGERLIAAMVVAYETFIRLQVSARLRESGWDQGFAIGIGATAGLCNLMQLTPEQTRHAIAITTTANVPMRASRAGQLSMWKGVATAYAVRNATFGALLAQAGMSGPEAPFSGRHGLIDLISGPIELPPFGTQLDDFLMRRVKIKYWPVAHSMQCAIWAGIELRKQVAVEQLVSIDVKTFWHAWHESGSEPEKWNPTTKETADHSLPYILAWSLKHDGLTQEAFKPESFRDPALRPLMKRITVSVDDEIEKQMPKIMRMRVTATDRAGKSYEVDIVNPRGHEDNPMSEDDVAAKFQRQCEPLLGAARTQAAMVQWRHVEAVSDLARALDAVAIAGG